MVFLNKLFIVLRKFVLFDKVVGNSLSFLKLCFLVNIILVIVDIFGIIGLLYWVSLFSNFLVIVGVMMKLVLVFSVIFNDVLLIMVFVFIIILGNLVFIVDSVFVDCFECKIIFMVFSLVVCMVFVIVILLCLLFIWIIGSRICLFINDDIEFILFFF